MTDHRTLPPEPSSIRTARRFVSEVLAATGAAPDTVSSAELVVSELATNAVTHTGSEFTVTVDSSGSRIRLEVEDAGPGQPALRATRADSVDGRGLSIVAALCTAWGVQRSGDHKTVWGELATH